jgi:hypothetical protein
LQEKPIYLFEQKYLTREAKKGRKKNLAEEKFSSSISTSHKNNFSFSFFLSFSPLIEVGGRSEQANERANVFNTREGKKSEKFILQLKHFD